MALGPLVVGKVSVYPPILQAPMAGISDKAFRLVNKSFGCPMVGTEMISDKALFFGSKETRRMISIDEGERPVSLQIFGSDAFHMSQAARIVCDSARPDILDINMGCPAPKVVRNGEGCALMRSPSLAASIIRAVVREAERSDVPVTVKMRLGWSRDDISVMELAKIAQDEGARAVTVHGRTRDEFYSGKADWGTIGLVKSELGIPVIGNGDIRSCGDIERVIRETGCDGFMVGRGCLGNPWIFRDLVAYLERGEVPAPPTLAERMETVRAHAALAVGDKGMTVAMKEMRKHLAWYVKGIRGAARIREGINGMLTLADLDAIIDELLRDYDSIG